MYTHFEEENGWKEKKRKNPKGPRKAFFTKDSTYSKSDTFTVF